MRLGRREVREARSLVGLGHGAERNLDSEGERRKKTNKRSRTEKTQNKLDDGLFLKERHYISMGGDDKWGPECLRNF